MPATLGRIRSNAEGTDLGRLWPRWWVENHPNLIRMEIATGTRGGPCDPCAVTRGSVALLVLALVPACDVALSEDDTIYSRGGDGLIVCGANIDDKNSVSVDSIAAGLERARADNSVLHLYAHAPPLTAQLESIETALGGAADRGMRFVKYSELTQADLGAGLAFSFDDHHLAIWSSMRPMFDRHGAKVTFFISAYHTLTEEERGQLRALADDGHDIQYHSTNHRNAADYAATHGAAAWITDDIAPDLAALRGDGYDPTAFAYPYGARNATTDAAILTVLPLARGSDFSCPR